MTSRITESVINLLRGIMGRAGILRPTTAIVTFCLCMAGLSRRVLISYTRKQYAFLSILIVALSSVSIPVSAQEIWLSGISPGVRQKMFQESESDYFDLFKSDAAWSKSAQHVKVFMINGGLLLRQSDDEVKAVFADLKRRHIALAMEMGLVTARQDSSGHQACGRNVEGITTPSATRVIAERIKKNSGELRYVAMDEPLWYGHHFGGANACHFTLSELAGNIVPNVAVLREMFPSVEIGDVEPIGTAQPPDWIEEIAQWTEVYRQIVGQKLSFFRADVAWTSPLWQQQLAAVKRLAHARGMKFGVIYDGGGTGKQESDGLWTQEAEQRFGMVESNPSLIPDHAVFQSWVRWPHKLLPETAPNTMTNLILQYVNWKRSRGQEVSHE
jgi:hypothetical protein